MEQFNLDFPTYCDEIKAAYKGDEAMRKKHPYWENAWQQLNQLFIDD